MLTWVQCTSNWACKNTNVTRLTADFVASLAILRPTAVSQTLMSWQLISHAFLKSDTPKNFWTIPSVHFKLDSKLNLKKNAKRSRLIAKVWIANLAHCLGYILWSDEELYSRLRFSQNPRVNKISGRNPQG